MRVCRKNTYCNSSDLLIIFDIRDYWLEAKRLLHDGFYASCGIICEYLFGCGVKVMKLNICMLLPDIIKAITQERTKNLFRICLVRHTLDGLLKNVLN